MVQRPCPLSVTNEWPVYCQEKAEQGEVKRHRSLFAINAKNRRETRPQQQGLKRKGSVTIRHQPH